MLLALIAAIAGVATSIQGAANAALAARIGLAATLLVNTLIVLVGALGFWLANGGQTRFVPPGTPWLLYVGGVCGFVVIASLAFAFPRIGAAVAIALVVLGQGAAALAIDHYGLLEMPQVPVTFARVGGLLLVGAGVVLIRG